MLLVGKEDEYGNRWLALLFIRLRWWQSGGKMIRPQRATRQSRGGGEHVTEKAGGAKNFRSFYRSDLGAKRAFH